VPYGEDIAGCTGRKGVTEMLNRILRVDMLKGQISDEVVPAAYDGLGGRALISAILAREVEPTCNPLGPANKLIIAPGLFAGTIIPNSGRLSVGAKSPLTLGMKESNVGGVAAGLLAQHGIQALIVENSSRSDVTYLEIGDEGVALRNFEEDPYMGNYDVAGLFQKKYGKDAATISVGPAGMRKRLCAGIAASSLERMPSRAAGRGGLGAVMGSKGLKAIMILPAKKAKTHPTETLREAVTAFSKSISTNEAVAMLHQGGTAAVVDIACMLGSFPTHSFRKGRFDRASNINAAKMIELQTQRAGKTGHRCMPGCLVACSNVYNDREGNYLTSGLEYETLCLLGSNLDIDDLDIIALFDRTCDDLGIDTIEVGGTMGVAMDKGMISYGDGRRVLELIREIGKDSSEGDLFGRGVARFAKEVGATRVPATGGQGHPGHDPRTLNAVGVTYATSPMGADHTAGLAVDPTKTGVVAMSRELQTHAMLCDAFGLCIFVSLSIEDITKVYNAFMNLEKHPDEMRALAVSWLRREAGFNERAGFPPLEERVGRIFREEALPESGNLFDTDYEEMKNIFA
jgi:aldehyde:ferredoxin oxidoreductase